MRKLKGLLLAVGIALLTPCVSRAGVAGMDITWEQFQDLIHQSTYTVVQNTIGLQNGGNQNTTFYGWVTDLNVVCTSGTVSWHTSWRNPASSSSSTFYTNDFYQGYFDHAVSSPGIVIIDSMVTNSTTQVTMGGYVCTGCKLPN